MTPLGRPLGRAFAAALFALAAVPTPAPEIVLEPVVVVDASVVLTGPDLPGSVGTHRIVATPSTPGHLELRLPWPGAGEGGASLSLRAETPPPGDEVHLVAGVAGTGAPPSRAVRRVRIGEPGEALWEVFRLHGRRVVLGIRAERQTRPAVAPPPKAGTPVAIRLVVERVLGGNAIPLESNDLHTFVGEPIEYAFRRGAGTDEERLRLVLVPLRIVGDVVQFSIEVSARLPGEGDPAPLSRREVVIASRGAESIVTVASGEPPAGYRFRFAPEF